MQRPRWLGISEAPPQDPSTLRNIPSDATVCALQQDCAWTLRSAVFWLDLPAKGRVIFAGDLHMKEANHATLQGFRNELRDMCQGGD